MLRANLNNIYEPLIWLYKNKTTIVYYQSTSIHIFAYFREINKRRAKEHEKFFRVFSSNWWLAVAIYVVCMLICFQKFVKLKCTLSNIREINFSGCSVRIIEFFSHYLLNKIRKNSIKCKLNMYVYFTDIVWKYGVSEFAKLT